MGIEILPSYNPCPRKRTLNLWFLILDECILNRNITQEESVSTSLELPFPFLFPLISSNMILTRREKKYKRLRENMKRREGRIIFIHSPFLPSSQAHFNMNILSSLFLHSFHSFPFLQFQVLLTFFSKSFSPFVHTTFFAIGLPGIFSFGCSLSPSLGCILKQPDSSKD